MSVVHDRKTNKRRLRRLRSTARLVAVSISISTIVVSLIVAFPIAYARYDYVGELRSSVIDPGGFAYFGDVRGVVVKVRLSDFTQVGTLTLEPSENGNPLVSAVIDTSRGYAYFGTNTVPGKIVRVRLSDFTQAGTITLEPGENCLWTAVIDTGSGFAYFGTWTEPGKIVKVRLSDFTRVGVVALEPGEDRLRSAVIDASAGFAYFGTETGPGRVVKVGLSDFARAGVLTLEPGEDDLQSAVIDPVNEFAYFGTYAVTQAGRVGASTMLGRVVRVRLSDFTRVGALTLEQDESHPTSAVIDASAGFAYFGTWPGKAVKVRLSDFTRAGAIVLEPGVTAEIVSAVIDPANGFAYFGTKSAGEVGRVVKVRLSDFTFVATLSPSPPQYLLKTTSPIAVTGPPSDVGPVVAIILLTAFFVAALAIIFARRSRATRPSARACPHCGFTNPPYARSFCVKCGSPLEAR